MRGSRFAGLAVIAATLGVAALIVVPALEQAALPAVPRGPSLAQAAAAQQPSATAATPPPVDEVPAATSPTVPVANRGPIGATLRAAVINPGVPPSRIASEPRANTAPSIELLVGYQWPLAHPRLTLPFGPTPWGTRIVDGQTFHDGIDIATFCGDHVHAAHAGTVLAAGRHFDDEMGWVGDLGPYYRRLDRKHAWMTLPIVVVIDDGNGYRSMYAHFSELVVRVGQRVRAGELLGYEGATGHASGCHVHYGLFSPWEAGTFRMEPDVARRLMTPKAEIARIDPLRVLPRKPPAYPRSTPSTPPTGG